MPRVGCCRTHRFGASLVPSSVYLVSRGSPVRAVPVHFGPKTDFATGEGARSVAIADLNIDGKPDLALVWACCAVSVLLNTTQVTGVALEPTVRPGVLMATPNPFAGRTSILLTLPAAQEVEVSVLDLGGRIVWRMPMARMEAGQHRIPWYGQDDSGRRVNAGLYFVQAHAGSGLNLRGTVVRLR